MHQWETLNGEKFTQDLPPFRKIKINDTIATPLKNTANFQDDSPLTKRDLGHIIEQNNYTNTYLNAKIASTASTSTSYPILQKNLPTSKSKVIYPHTLGKSSSFFQPSIIDHTSIIRPPKTTIAPEFIDELAKRLRRLSSTDKNVVETISINNIEELDEESKELEKQTTCSSNTSENDKPLEVNKIRSPNLKTYYKKHSPLDILLEE